MVNRVTRGRALVGSVGIGGGVGVKKFSTGTFSVNPASIAANVKGSIAVTLTGVAAGDLIELEPSASLETGLSYVGNVASTDTVTIYLLNGTAGAIDGAALTWRYFWWDLT